MCWRPNACTATTHAGTGAGRGQDRQGPALGLCPRRPPVRRRRTACAALFKFSRDRRGAHPKPAPRTVGRRAPGRRPCGLRRALYWRSPAATGNRSAVLGARAAQVLRVRRHCGEDARRGKDAKPISPLGLEAVRRIDAIFDLERTINGADSATRLALRREPGLRRWSPISSAGCARARTPLPPRQRGPGDGLHAQALGPLRPVSRG